LIGDQGEAAAARRGEPRTHALCEFVAKL
jgi:hypothetical protein